MQRILVIRFSSLGDIVLTEPIVRQLRQQYPDSEIHYLTKTQYSELLSLYDGIDRVHLWDSEAGGKTLIRQLRQITFDLTIDLHDNLRSRKVRSAVGAMWVSTRKEWFKRFASVRMRWLKMQPSHAINRYAGALRSLGFHLTEDTPQLTISEDHRKQWTDLKAARNFIGDYYVIAAGAAHATKRAPHALWVQIAQQFSAGHRLRALLVGAPSEQGILEELQSQLGKNCAGILCEDSIALSSAAIADSQFVLSNDSGVAHLAAALDKPTLALFGPTHPVLGFAPRSRRAIPYTVNEYCSPCSLHGRRPCHRDQRYCFTRMEVVTVVDQINALVGREERNS